MTPKELKEAYSLNEKILEIKEQLETVKKCKIIIIKCFATEHLYYKDIKLDKEDHPEIIQILTEKINKMERRLEELGIDIKKGQKE
jgi:hypothetical protein